MARPPQSKPPRRPTQTENWHARGGPCAGATGALLAGVGRARVRGGFRRKGGFGMSSTGLFGLRGAPWHQAVHHRRRCAAIRTSKDHSPSPPLVRQWVWEQWSPTNVKVPLPPSSPWAGTLAELELNKNINDFKSVWRTLPPPPPSEMNWKRNFSPQSNGSKISVTPRIRAAYLWTTPERPCQRHSFKAARFQNLWTAEFGTDFICI